MGRARDCSNACSNMRSCHAFLTNQRTQYAACHIGSSRLELVTYELGLSSMTPRSKIGVLGFLGRGRAVQELWIPEVFRFRGVRRFPQDSVHRSSICRDMFSLPYFAYLPGCGTLFQYAMCLVHGLTHLCTNSKQAEISLFPPLTLSTTCCRLLILRMVHLGVATKR